MTKGVLEVPSFSVSIAESPAALRFKLFFSQRITPKPNPEAPTGPWEAGKEEVAGTPPGQAFQPPPFPCSGPLLMWILMPKCLSTFPAPLVTRSSVSFSLTRSHVSSVHKYMKKNVQEDRGYLKHRLFFFFLFEVGSAPSLGLELTTLTIRSHVLHRLSRPGAKPPVSNRCSADHVISGPENSLADSYKSPRHTQEQRETCPGGWGSTYGNSHEINNVDNASCSNDISSCLLSARCYFGLFTCVLAESSQVGFGVGTGVFSICRRGP